MDTRFWQIAGLILQVVQMFLYLAAVRKYKEKLEEFADYLRDSGMADEEKYMTIRDCDPDFYAYYKGLPLYAPCESAIKRNKGEAFFKYGSQLRRRLRSTRGYTPLTRVHFNTQAMHQAISEAAVSRAITCIRENKRVDAHILERWSAIVSAPVNVEGYSPAFAKQIVDSNFRSLKGFARGFNSAGAALGTSLFRILN